MVINERSGEMAAFMRYVGQSVVVIMAGDIFLLRIEKICCLSFNDIYTFRKWLNLWLNK